MRTTMSRADVIALLLATLLLLALVPVALAQNAELANRATCAANVRGIMQSMHVYGADNNDIYPYIPGTSATKYDATLKPELGGKNPDETFAKIYAGKKFNNNPNASLWILVVNGYVAPKQFLCKSDPFANKTAQVTVAQQNFYPEFPAPVTYYTNFQESKNVSYSTAYQWVEDKNKKIVPGNLWKANSDASVAILSDMAPYLASKPNAGEPATRPAASDPAAPVDAKWAVTTANSQNHQYEGQNIAFGDAHAEFQRTPKAGQKNDSIWGVRKNVANADEEIPLEPGELPHPLADKPGDFDIVMIPTRDAKGELK